MFGRSRAFRLLRPRYRIIMRLLSSATAEEAKQSDGGSPRKPSARATGRIHKELGRAQSKVSPQTPPVNENAPESTACQLETAEQQQQTNALQCRQRLVFPWVSLRRGRDFEQNRGCCGLPDLSGDLSHEEKQRFLDTLYAEQYRGVTATADSPWLGGRCHCPGQTGHLTYPQQGDLGEYGTTASPFMGDESDLFAARTSRVWPWDVIQRKGHLQCSNCNVDTCSNAFRRHELDATIDRPEFDWLNTWLMQDIYTQDHTVSGRLILHSGPVLSFAAACVSPAVDSLLG